jgi:hypothetical protein
MNSLVKFSAVTSYAFCLCMPGDRSTNGWHTAGDDYESDDYAQRFWLHNIELGRWWRSAVKSLIAQQKQLNVLKTKLKLAEFRHSEALLYDLIFLVLLLKGQVYEIMYCTQR